jgi:hypothetical protein
MLLAHLMMIELNNISEKNRNVEKDAQKEKLK